MSQSNPSTSLPPGMASRLNPVCDRFEDQWLAGAVPRLEEFLPLVDEAVRPALLRELLELELLYRRRRGEHATVEEYRQRLPEYADLIGAAFAAADLSGGPPPQCQQPLPIRAPDTAVGYGRDRAGEDAPATVDGPKEQSGHPPGPVADLLPEQIGRYRILGRVGAGGMGTVFRAHDPELQRIVALKVPRFEGPPPAQQQARQRFLREARAAAAIRHAHVCPIHDVGEQQGRPYVVMAFVEGESLAEHLGRVGRFEDCRSAVQLVCQVAEALTAVHGHGIIHRDLKPGNILLDQQGQAVLTDFGLARSTADAEHLTANGALLGTPAYMAPEQAAPESGEMTVAADIYSLGVVLYRMLTGRVPFEGQAMMLLYKVAQETPPSPAQFRTDLDPALVAIIQKAMARRPQDRYASARQLSEALTSWLGHVSSVPSLVAAVSTAAAQKPQGYAPSTRAGSATAGKRRRLPLLLGAVVFLVGLVGLGGWALIRIQTDQGDYVIETDDPNFYFQVNKQGGVTLEDRKTRHIYHLKVLRQDRGTGERELEVTDPGADLSFQTKTFTIRRGQQVALKAWIERKPTVAAALPPATDEDAWLKVIAALPAARQVVMVAAWLKERNSGFDGQVAHQIEGGVVTSLEVPSALVQDLTPVRALTGLRTLTCRSTVGYDNKAESDAALLRSLKKLETINGKPMAQFWKEFEARQAEFKAWLQLVAVLVPEQQVAAVAARLKERNIGFDGQVTHKIEGDVVTELEFCSDNVMDISPVRALAGLRTLKCNGSTGEKGQLADLSPLKDMKLTELYCWYTKVSDLSPLKDMKLTKLDCFGTQVSDLSPLKEMKLTYLECTNTKVSDLLPLKDMKLTTLLCFGTQVSDLSPLKEMKLTYLNCTHTPVSDLSPLKDMKLEELQCWGTQVTDLSPLKDMKLTILNCGSTKVSDLSVLKNMKLTSLICGYTPVSDLSPLKGMMLTYLKCGCTQVSDLSPLKDMKLTTLVCDNTQVTDLSPLKGMPVKELWCDFKAERDTEILRSLKTLEKINDKPAQEFWKEVDAKK